jgi:hypothetical protein
MRHAEDSLIEKKHRSRRILVCAIHGLDPAPQAAVWARIGEHIRHQWTNGWPGQVNINVQCF